MKFQVIPTHEALRPFIHNYWHLQAMATDEGSQRIMANGRVALQFYRAQPISFADDPRLFTCSLNVHDIQFIDLRTCSGLLDIIGAEFTPFGAHMFFPMPMSHCVGSHLKPDDLGDREFCELEERLLGTTDEKACYALLDDFFFRSLLKNAGDGLNVRRLQSVFHLAESQQVSAGNILTTADLANEACLSSKQFGRIFQEYVGLNPKSYLRLLRCHAAVLALQNKRPNQTLTEIAWSSGYYDLSHMTSDLLQIHGTTPSEVLATIRQRHSHTILSQAFQPVFSHVMKKLIRMENLI